MRLLSVFAFCAVALADSKPEADLRQRLAASETARAALENSIATPRSQMSTRLKDADASTRAAATGRSEAKATAAVQSDAIAGVRRTTDDIQLQIAEIPLEIAKLKPPSPFSSVTVILALIALVSMFLGSAVTVALAIVNHGKIDVVSEHVNGMVEKMGAAREQKGLEEGRAESRQS